MTKAVITAKPTDTIEKVIRVMDKTGVGGLVIEENEEVKGIITEGDIISEIAEDCESLEKPISGVMKTPVKTVPKEIDLEEALKVMRDLDIERLPVVTEENKLIGLVTERDLMKVEPALIEMAREKKALEAIKQNRKEEVKGTGNCEECEMYSNNLKEFEGKFLCSECREERI